MVYNEMLFLFQRLLDSVVLWMLRSVKFRIKIAVLLVMALPVNAMNQNNMWVVFLSTSDYFKNPAY